MQTHRRPKPKENDGPDLNSETSTEPSANWLKHLVTERKKQNFIEPTPRELAQQAIQKRVEQDQAVVDILAQKLDSDSFDEATVREHLKRYGPFEPQRVLAVIELCFDEDDSKDRHVSHYLERIREQLGGTL